MQIKIKFGVYTLVYLLFASSVRAEEVDGARTVEGLALQEISVTAPTFKPETVEHQTGVSLRALPASITSVTATQLEQQGVTGLTEALQNVTGLQPTDGGMANDYRSRGLGVSFFRDGVFDGNAQNSYYRSLVDVAEIEVLKGPGAVIFGSSAPGGVIHLVTKQPMRQFGLTTEAGVGSFGSRHASVDVTGGIKDGVTGRLILNTENSNGYRGLGRELNEILPSLKLDLDESRSLLLDVDYRVSHVVPDNYGIPFNFQRKIADVATENRYYTPFAMVDQTVVRTSLVHDWQLNDTLNMKTTLVYDTRDLDILRNVRGNAEDSAGRLTRRSLRQQFDDADYFTVQNEWRWEVNTGDIAHQILSGITYTNARIDALRNGYQLPSINSVSDPLVTETAIVGLTKDQSRSYDREIRSDNTAIYLNDYMQLNDAWKLNAGLRNEHVKASDKGVEGSLGYREIQYDRDLLSGSLGLVFQPVKDWTLYTSYTNGAFNNINTKVTQISERPEKSKQLEVGSKWTWQDVLTIDLAWFKMNRENYLFDLPEADSTTDGKDVSYGTELGFMVKPSQHFKLTGNAVWIRPRVETDVLASLNALGISSVSVKGTEPVGVSRRIYNVWGHYDVQYAAFKGLSVGLGATYRSETYADALNQYQVPAFLVFNGNVRYQMPHWEFSLRLNNLTNKAYFNTTTNIGAVPGEARSAFFNIKYTY